MNSSPHMAQTPGWLPPPLAAWWHAIRPSSFTATITPVVVGIGYAALNGFFTLGWALLTLLAALLLQAGTNLLNDYFDYRNGVDSSAASGFSSMIQQGLLTPFAVLAGGFVCFALAALFGIALAIRGGPIIWALGILGVVIGVLYTSGPKPLAYVGLGEVAVFIAMGPAMVLGAYVVQAQQGSWAALLAGVPIGLLVAAILHANNLRDIETDRVQGKITLAVRLGRYYAQREYALLVLGAYVLLLPLVIVDWRLSTAALPALLTLPRARALVHQATTSTDRQRLNRVLRSTAVLHGQFGLLWAIGLVIAVALYSI